MCIEHNIYISIMCEWLFKIISKHGVKCQFVSTPGVICQDGKFTINTLLYPILNHNLPTCVALSDQVKALYTSNHAILMALLENMVPPMTMISNQTHVWKSVVKIIIDNIETDINFKLGVKQGYIMASVLFLFMMMAFSKTLEDEWNALGLSKSQFACKDNS